jgi:multicomponent Na+:H+ antiporter subunit G
MGALEIIEIALMAFGLFFFFGGAVGILRFPDFYTRLHPAGKLDTMGSFFMLAGLALYSLGHFSIGEILVSLKIMLIVAFVFLASPTATHAIVDAGLRAGLKPLLAKDEEEQL